MLLNIGPERAEGFGLRISASTPMTPQEETVSRLALLAHYLSFGINALHEKVNPYGAGISASGLTRHVALADLVARAVDLDMVEAGWEPAVDGYLNRVPKARILEAVREAKREGTAQLLDHL